MKTLPLTLFLWFISYSVASMEIIAPRISGLIEEDGKGVYQILLKKAADQGKIPLSEVVLPQKRALSEFFNKNFDCIYAYTDIAVETLGKHNIKVSFPLGVFKQYIFTKKGTRPLTEISQLQGYSVGGVLGDADQSWYKKISELGINYQFSERIELNVGMLRRDRIDAIVSFMPDMAQFEQDLSYAKEFPLFTAFDRVTCHNNQAGNDFINKISPILQNLKKSGVTQEVLGDMYLAFDEETIPRY